MAISVAIGQALAAIFTLIIEALRGVALPPLWELVCIAGVVTFVIILGWIAFYGQTRAKTLNRCWVLLPASVLGWPWSALVPLGVVSREVNPLIAAWAWEAGIGLVGLMMATTRFAIVRSPPIFWRLWLKVGVFHRRP